ncbi:hypothetical protein ACQEV9_15495 [Streptomyces chartreusis]|uniref:hypothetical protein n=1 Tax=Streptomyces chartreusis TaxID=1969 RepID=UPI003D93F7C0
MNYKLANGYTVTTRNVDQGKEFETRNAEGETISTVRLGYLEANALVRDLVSIGRKVR